MADKDTYDGLGPRGLRPLVNTELDMKSAKLTTVEGFVLSRVDGLTSYREITMVTGLPPDETLKIMRGLKQSGLIFNPGETPVSVVRGRTASAPPPAPAAKPKSVIPSYPSLLKRLDDGSVVDPALMSMAPDLEYGLKMSIVRAHRRLPRLNAAALLGVAADAGPKVFKQAYFSASKELHPDRYYGRDIGRFRHMLEELFKACTKAFDDLNAPYKRKKS